MIATRLLAVSMALALGTAAVGQEVLLDNGPIVTHAGAGVDGADVSAVQTALGLFNLGYGFAVATGFRVADDFEVTASSGWQLDSFEVLGYQTGSGLTSTISAMNFRIWDGPPGEAGSEVIYGDGTGNALVSGAFSGVYRATDTDLTEASRPIMRNLVDASNVFLAPGTYWLDVQADGTLASGPWLVPITLLGETVTGDALQFDPGPQLWGALQVTSPQGMPFVLRGWDGYVALAPEFLAESQPKRGDANVPVLAFSAATVIAPGLELTSLSIATVGSDGVTPVGSSPVAAVKLFHDADGDGVPDDTASPLGTAVTAPDGTAELVLRDVLVASDAPTHFVLAYDLKDSLSASVPLAAAGLALLLPGWWLARRGRRAAALLAFGLAVTVVSACSPAPPVAFRAVITGATSEVADGLFAGREVPVESPSPLLGGTLTVVY